MRRVIVLADLKKGAKMRDYVGHKILNRLSRARKTLNLVEDDETSPRQLDKLLSNPTLANTPRPIYHQSSRTSTSLLPLQKLIVYLAFHNLL